MKNYQELSDQTEHIMMRHFFNLANQTRAQLAVETPDVRALLNQKANEVRHTANLLTVRLAAEIIHTATEQT